MSGSMKHEVNVQQAQRSHITVLTFLISAHFLLFFLNLHKFLITREKNSRNNNNQQKPTDKHTNKTKNQTKQTSL